MGAVAAVEGFPYGIAFLILIGETLSVAATVMLALSLGQGRRGAPRQRWAAVDVVGRIGAGFGVVVVGIWLALWVLINQPIDVTSWHIAEFGVFAVASTLMAVSKP